MLTIKSLYICFYVIDHHFYVVKEHVPIGIKNIRFFEAQRNIIIYKSN